MRRAKGGKEDTKSTFVDEEADGRRLRTLLAVGWLVSVSKGALYRSRMLLGTLTEIANQMVITILENLLGIVTLQKMGFTRVTHTWWC